MKKQVLATLENSRNYTLRMADAMPEDLFTFKATDTMMNFGELFQHIGYGILWWQENFIKGKKTDWSPPLPNAAKAHVIRYLNEAYDSLEKTVQGKQFTDESVAGFHATLDHITHHRGQAVVYLRSKGIAPPEYMY